MRRLEKVDQEIYDAIILGNKMNIGEKVFNSICKSKKLDIKSSEYWFYKALLLSESLQGIGSEMEIFDLYEELLESCDIAIEIEENHWPAYFLRSLFSLLIQEFLKDEDETIQYLIPCYRSYEEQLSEVNELINIQNTYGYPENFMSYCLLALIYLEENDIEEAIKSLKEGFEKTTVGKVVYLATLFKIPMYKLYYHKKLQNNEIIKLLQNRFKEISLLT